MKIRNLLEDIPQISHISLTDISGNNKLTGHNIMNGQYFCLEHCTDTQNVIKFERYDYDIFIFSK